MIIPETQFFLFGMGNRPKFIYKSGELISYPDYKVIHKWDVKEESFIFDKYTVILTTTDSEKIILKENENGFYINDECICKSKIILPDFEEYEYSKQLRILHHEILINVIDGLPVPNFFVYKKPWYRDGAMMGMVLKHTGNLDLIKDWILSITDFYDKNNSGYMEPDNLGELLYLISLVSDKNNPMVEKVINEAKRIMENGTLTGITDFGDHNVYSTLWLKYALNELGIDTDFITIPYKFDNYSRMFWMDRSEVERETEYENSYNDLYPYLWWAVKHFENENIDEGYLTVRYPMSWEQEASQAVYPSIAPLSQKYADNFFSAPHTWHAAEMFLYLIEKRK